VAEWVAVVNTAVQKGAETAKAVVTAKGKAGDVSEVAGRVKGKGRVMRVGGTMGVEGGGTDQNGGETGFTATTRTTMTAALPVLHR
jgi:hypothetical protein